MGVKNSNRYNKSKKQAVNNKMFMLEEIRQLSINVEFPIRSLLVAPYNYLVKVYYMGTINEKGMMIPITASVDKINELRDYIEKWASDNGRV